MIRLTTLSFTLTNHYLHHQNIISSLQFLHYEFVIDITKGIDGEKSAKSVKVENLNFSEEPFVSVYDHLVNRYGQPPKTTKEFVSPAVPNIHTMNEIREDDRIEEAVASSNIKGRGIRKFVRGKLR